MKAVRGCCCVCCACCVTGGGSRASTCRLRSSSSKCLVEAG
jgi:hypothetical protein